MCVEVTLYSKTLLNNKHIVRATALQCGVTNGASFGEISAAVTRRREELW